MTASSLDQALNQLTAASRCWTIKRYIVMGRDAYEVSAWSASKCPGRRVVVRRLNRIDAVLAALNELTGASGKTKKLRLVGG